MNSRVYSLLLVCGLLVCTLILVGTAGEGLAAPDLQDPYPWDDPTVDPYAAQPTTAVVPTSQATAFPTAPRATGQPTGLPTFSPTPSPTTFAGLTLTAPPPTATGPTPTLLPLPSITPELPTPSRTPIALSSLSRPRPSPGLQKVAPEGLAALRRYVPLLFILLIWMLLGGWFFLSARQVGPLLESEEGSEETPSSTAQRRSLPK